MGRFLPVAVAACCTLLGSPQLLGMREPGSQGPAIPSLPITGLYQLRDETYYFPANRGPGEPTVYLPLQRWDMIFTGNWRNYPGSDIDHENINRIIPGDFNHMAVYMGKDAHGMAYIVEMMPSEEEHLHGIRLVNIGSDFGWLRPPIPSDLHERSRLTHRWAKRLREPELSQLRASEADLLARIHWDLITGFPYQYEYRHSGSLLDFTIWLVDDGLEGGAGCADYWTALFEQYAGICLKNVRFSAEELMRYFRRDPQGRLAIIPEAFNILEEPTLFRTLLALGFSARSAAPHVHSCDGSEEYGLVMPAKVSANERLEDIPPAAFPPMHLHWWAVPQP